MSRLDLARVRHENAIVLTSLRHHPDLDRAERARRLGLGEFQLVLALRRLARTGLVDFA